jgi:hypothetical protein
MTAFGPWYFRFFAVLFLLRVARTAPMLALVLIMAASAIVLGQLLYTTQRIPRLVMDVLDRLTDKRTLEKEYDARSAKLSLISAEDLAESLNSRLIGTRTRPSTPSHDSCAGASPPDARTNRSPFSVWPGRPASARRTSASSWPRRCSEIARTCTSST